MLCLHGYNTNLKCLRSQMRHFCLVFQEVMDFHFVDAPFQVTKEDPPKELKRFLSQPTDRFRSWFAEKNQTDAETPTDLTQQDSYITHGVEHSCNYLAQVMREQGPFDGVIGFS